MGGLGKTTLTRKVFHLKAKFGSHIWVHVSQNFDPITLFKKIFKELKPDQVEVEISRQDILKKLEEALRDQTYLLVLDDVWNENLPIWEAFINSLLGVTSTQGNAIVVTTRSMKVASTVSPIHTSQLRGLSDELCWSIIKAKSFGNKDCPSEYEAIGRKIAKRCQGLPLAANVVGGVMRNISEETWLSIEEKWLSRDEDGITNILRLSFDSLSPPSLKKCFAYCSVFPKAKEIRKQALIEYWMAEGFLQDDGSTDMESVGDKFINVLVQNSLLQVVTRDDYGDIKVCQMHDLVHDLASSVLSSSSNADGMRRVRYMTHEHQSSLIPKEVAKYLRTLFLEGEISGDAMFSNLECVHVLAIGGKEVMELPTSIRKLIHMRNLDISKTCIEHLPDWIGELHHLQTLRVNTNILEKLPRAIKYLANLRHLHIDNIVELPAGIGRLTSLQTLTQFTVGDKNGCKIEELGSLTNLTGELNINNLERVGDKEEAEKANLYKKSKISELYLTWDKGREGETRNDENVLEGLQPHPNVKKLLIKGFKGKLFPSWSEKMTVRDGPRGAWEPLNKLIKIKITQCSECEEIPMLGHLPNLKSLFFAELSSVKCIKSSFYGLVKKETRIVFPALEFLYLHDMPNLVEWEEVELAGASEVKKVFPQLQLLKIRWCDLLMSAPTHFSSSFNHLEIRGTVSYMTLANISLKLTSLTNLCLEGIDGLECLPDWLFYNNPNLSKLEIKYCHNLREFPDGLCSLKYLERLIVWNCPNLEQIGDSGGQESQGSLRHLEIYGCPALVYLPCEMVGSSLEELTLRDLSSIKNLPRLIDCLAKSRLTKLTIVGLPEFMATCRVEKWPFRSLQRMEVDASIGGSMETVDSILQACCHSLDVLLLKGMDWQLPESIQHLTALSELELKNFGMEVIPEWFGDLPSLKRLYLSNCKELRCLPSLDAMRRLTALQHLSIEDCPEYSIDEQQSDAEWPKISHIPKIYINGSKPNARERR